MAFKVRKGQDVVVLLFLSIISLVFLAVSLATPWYIPAYVQIPNSDCAVTTLQHWYHMIERCSTEDCRRIQYLREDVPCDDDTETWRDTCPPQIGFNRIANKIIEKSGVDVCSTTKQGQVWDAAFAFMIIAGSFALFTVLFSLFRQQRPHLALWGGWKPQMGLWITQMVCVLVALIVHSVALPDAVEEDIGCPTGHGPCERWSGTLELRNPEGAVEAIYKWGPGPGWIIAVVNFVWQALGVIVCVLSIPLYPKIEPKPGQKNPADTGDVPETELGE